ncbi:TonB-dependent receptor [Emticicia sp. CRIBPO]|uniref:TonB-dependent receptor n=1 Tax=Emticicia sp. CRIBPO TaxID=2683258 RepID=UPI0014129A46|nr:TonB-dependent receptor [Emticicia sp. CRIBPO]NBA84239.1 TonB-dependent receptor [Emticicia sp. CRIBPO]
MKKLLFLTLISLQTLAQKQACECFITGRITDFTTKEPVVGAVVLIKEINKGVLTDAKGNYEIRNLCEGKYTLIGRIVGYQQQEFVVNLSHSAEQDIHLKEDEIHLARVEITAKKLENITQNQTSIDDKELKSTMGETLAGALKGIAGVTMLQTGSSIAKPVIHGLHSNRILILNNGVRQEGQQWGSEHSPEIDPFVAKKITVIKGASGVRYGSDAIGGVILAESNDLTVKDSILTEINQVYFSNGRQFVTSAIAEGGTGKKSHLLWRVQGTYKKGGNISAPDYNLANTGVDEKNFSATVGYHHNGFKSEAFFSQFNTKIGIFAGSHIGNVTDLKLAIEQPRPQEIYTPEKFTYKIDRPYQDIQHNLAKLKFSKKLGATENLSVTLGRQYNFRSEIDVLRGDRNLAQVFKITTYSYEVLYDHKPFKGFRGYFGSNGLFQQNLSTGTVKLPQRSTVIIPNFLNNTFGVFLIERLVRKKTEWEGGLRFDYRKLNVYYLNRESKNLEKPVIHNANFSGTLGFNHRFNNHLDLNVNLATTFRGPSVNELYSDGVHHGSASYELGDPSLKPETAYNNSVTLKYVSGKFDAELHGYLNYINDYIFISPTGRPLLTIRGAFPEFKYTQTNAFFNGIDFSFNVSLLSHLKLTSKASYLVANDRNNDQPLIFIPANRIDNTLRWTPSFKLLDEISINHLFVARQTRVPSKIIFNDADPSTIVFNEFGGDFSAPPAAYHVFNLQMKKDLVLTGNNPLTLSLEVKNLFNTAYRDYLNRFRYFTDEMGRNIVARITYKF